MSRTKVLMLGWEFPPYFAGGVGIVCAELSRALSRKGVEITYVMPKGPKQVSADGVRLLIANNLVDDEQIDFMPVDSLLHAYASTTSYTDLYQRMLAYKENDTASSPLYGSDLWSEVHRFAEKVRLIAAFEQRTRGFDVIHAHDHWTFPAAVAAKHATGKPLIVHVHITEFDKTGGHGIDRRVYDMERYGMINADVVIAVSNFIKSRLVHDYHIPADKIRVVHNAATTMQAKRLPDVAIKEHDRIILFAGRVTLQKGPDYFIEAARIVAEQEPNIKFVMAGSGDMLGRCIERVAELGLSNRFLFTGFYTRDQAEQIFSMADLFVMPSVSEPFGVVPLEAMAKDTPCIVSKQSGVSEVLTHCIKVDFWDVERMAEHMLAIMRYRALHAELTRHGALEVKQMTWDAPAGKCLAIYNELAGG